jgi:hypothetical protein
VFALISGSFKGSTAALFVKSGIEISDSALAPAAFSRY